MGAGKPFIFSISNRWRIIMPNLVETNEVRDVPAVEPESGSPIPEVRPLATLIRPALGDSEELIASRYLCRGAGALLVGPTGIGKSSLAMQFMLSWAIGRDCFGFTPTRPIKSLLIQAENDDGDLAEMRDGVLAGLGLSKNDRKQALDGVLSATVDDRTSINFVTGVVEPLASKYEPDVVWIDPLFSYLGGDVSQQEVVSAFLRNWLNPVLHRHKCAVVLLHHVNKPPSGRKEKPDWQAGDFAYLGSGSADLANWARAVIALRAVGSHDVFELRACKRGARLGWVESDSQTRRYSIHIAHAKEPGAICWRTAEQSEVEVTKGGRPAVAEVNDLVALLDGQQLTSGEWQKLAKSEAGISERVFFRLKKDAKAQRLVSQSKVDSKWFKNR
jgi:hypothetical protein